MKKDIAQVYKTHEREKKRTYNERIIQVKKDTFTPIVVSTFGGMGQEAKKFHKRVKSVLTSIRGVGGKRVRESIEPISSFSFNLINFDN